MRLLKGGLMLLGLAAGLPASTPCPTTKALTPGATLDDLAKSYFGDPRYAITIALATNARTAEGFHYISNPDNVTAVPQVCIPSKPEARDLMRRWESYDRAVSSARLPRTAGAGASLVTVPADQPANVVAWVRKDQADRMKTASGAWIESAPAETWVTVEPHLQQFCRAAVGDQKLDEGRLTDRLEQRLGLAPASSKGYFVRIRLEHPGPDVIFRPCIDPAADHVGCSVGPPSSAPAEHQQWIYQQYYSSYGQSLISEFPWTALGYTFDWAPVAGRGKTFQRSGESEFVIHKGAPIQIVEVMKTAEYCAPGSR